MQWKTAKFFWPHLADLAATANFFFWLSINVLSNWYNSPAKLKALNFSDMTSENHLLFHILVSLSHFSHLLSQVFFLMSLSDVSVSRLLSPVSHLLSPVSYLLSPVQHILSPISHLLSPVSHLLSPISHILSHVSCLNVLCLLSHVSYPYLSSYNFCLLSLI